MRLVVIYISLLFIDPSTLLGIEYFNPNTDNEDRKYPMDSVVGVEMLPDESRCFQLGMCQGRRENLQFSKINCFCDDLCVLYNDCCTDYVSETNNEPIAEGTFICTSHMENITFPNVQNVLVTNQCPDAYMDNDVKQQCEAVSQDLFLKIPVSDTKSNVLYKNLFCGICHGVRQEDLALWSIQLNCENNPQNLTVSELYDTLSVPYTSCSREFVKPDGTTRARRCKNSTQKCPDQWNGPQDISTQCKNHTNYVYYLNNVYKNKFCAQCHGADPAHLRCEMPLTHDDLGNPARPPSFRVMMDLTSGVIGVRHHSTIIEERIIKKACPESHVHDPFSSTCRVVTCPRGQQLSVDRTMCIQVRQHVAYSKVNDTNDTLMSCPSMRYNLSMVDITWTTNNESIIIQNQIYTKEEYAIRDESIYVCILGSMSDTYTETTNVTMSDIQLNYDQIESLVTIVGLSISLVCLVLCISIHCAFPQLQNNAGKCVIGLSVSLFTGQLLFLISGIVNNYVLCYALAILLHYSFLASFCWTNCLSIDMCLAFSTNFSVVHNNKKRYIKYSAYSWCLPLLFILLAVVLDITPGIPDAYQPHYGEGYCLINRSGALLVVFATPMGFILLLNLALFVITTKNIYQAKKMAKLVIARKRGARVMDFVLYTKLYVIMGLTWLVGFFASTVENHILWYIFIVLNTLQGMFLCLAFLLTKRTKKLIKQSRFGSSISSNAMMRRLRSSSEKKSTG